MRKALKIINIGSTAWMALVGTMYGQTTLSPDLAGMGSSSIKVAISSGIDGTTSSVPTSVPVVVQFKNPPTQADLNSITAIGGVYQKTLNSANAGHFQIPRSALSSLARLTNVKYATPDRIQHMSLEFARPAVNAQIAQQYGYDGSGVGIAVIDSGVTSVPDLANGGCGGSRVVYSETFALPGANGAYGHGTHVAGIAAGNGSCAVPSSKRLVTFRGIAPGANIVDLRVLDANGNGYDSSVIAAIDRAIQLQYTYNIRVINLSLGRAVMEGYALDPVCQAVERAWQAGIVVVVAAGNMGRYPNTSGYGTIESPGNDPFVITVGAMNDKQTAGRGDDIMTSYSSKGPSEYDFIAKPDLVAPGNAIVSTLASTSATLATSLTIVPTSYYTSASWITPQYMKLSGTSMASPMVSGAAALLLQKTPSLTPNQVKARLMKTATKNFPSASAIVDPSSGITYNVYYDLFTVGAGYLDVWAALNNGDLNHASSTTPLSPAVVRSTTGTMSLAAGTSLVWGDTLVWGDSLVWGDLVILHGTQQIAGASLVWGDTLIWGDTLVWGDTLIWGDVAQKGDN